MMLYTYICQCKALERCKCEWIVCNHCLKGACTESVYRIGALDELGQEQPVVEDLVEGHADRCVPAVMPVSAVG